MFSPLPVSFNVDEMAVQVRPRRKGIFFRWQQTTPLFTPPTLKRRGKGCKGSSNQMSMGTFFRRHRYIEKRCWVCRMCSWLTCVCACIRAACAHACGCVRALVHACVCLHEYACSSTHACMHAGACARSCTIVCVCLHEDSCSSMHECVCARSSMRVCVCAGMMMA